MKALIPFTAFALLAPAFAAPALAEIAQPDPIAAGFLGLKDALIANVGNPDSVIMLYAAFDGDLANPGFEIFVRYRSPDGRSVVTQGAALGPVVGSIFTAAGNAYDTDPSWRSTTLVIDRGAATATTRRIADFDASKTIQQRVSDETARIFPGLTVDTYRGPGS